MSANNWTFVTSKQVWMDSSLSIEAKAIWHILSAWRDHATGESFPRVWTLQRVSGIGRNKVERAITELVKAGAITKKIIRRRGATGMMGSKCIYGVTKLSDWKGRDIYKENVSCSSPVPPRSGAPTNLPLSVSHSKSLTHPQTVTHLFSPSSMEPTDLLLTETEIENLLADRDASVASAVWERICSAPGRDRHGRPYRSREEQEKCIQAFADHIEECRAGTR